MKIIDLLVKISKGEEVPKKIKYDGMIFDYQEDTYEYLCYEENNFSLLGYDNPYDMLNDNVEIIEEEKEIEKLNLDTDELLKNVVITAQNYVIEGKINELIDVINDMRDKEC